MIIRLIPPSWARWLVGDPTDWLKRPQALAATGAPPTDIELRVPDDGFIEYAWMDAEGRVRPDPGNPRQAANPWWPNARLLVGERYAPAPELASLPAAPQGQLDRLRVPSRALGATRRALVYTPACCLGDVPRALPVVYVQDGVATHHIAELDRVLELLLARGELSPARLVFVQPEERDEEYRFHPGFEAFMLEELIPFVEARYPCSGERLLMGASLGGLVSATLALKHPTRFAGVIAQSGAFLFGPGDDLETYDRGGEWVVHELRRRPVEDIAHLRWTLDCGTVEWLTPVNRRLVAALRRRGLPFHYGERNAGHNWANWRDGLPSLLRHALGPGSGLAASDT